MPKKKLTRDQLRALILAEAEKDPRCEGLRDIRFFGTEDDAENNWTVAFAGITPGEDSRAVAAILARLSAEYDVAWETRH